MAPVKQTEEAIALDHENREEQSEEDDRSLVGFKSLLWHGGSVYDAWFSCASNQALIKQTHNFNFNGSIGDFSYNIRTFFFCRLPKFCLLCPTLSLNWGCFQGLFCRFSMGFLGAGRPIWSVFCMLSIEAGRRRRMLASRTMSSRSKKQSNFVFFFVFCFYEDPNSWFIWWKCFGYSGLKCWMVFLGLIGKRLDWLLIVLSSSLALSSSLLPVQGPPFFFFFSNLRSVAEVLR